MSSRDIELSLPARPTPVALSSSIKENDVKTHHLPFLPRAINSDNHPRALTASPTHFSAAAFGPSLRANSAVQVPSSDANYTPYRVENYGMPGTPVIQNPFPIPGNHSNNHNSAYGSVAPDPELESQIAQWQSAYSGKDGPNSIWARSQSGSKWHDESLTASAGSNLRQDIHSSGAGSYNILSGVAEVVTAADGKQKTVVRSGGGQSWQDPSLLEWDPAHFRLFVGNLAGEVTDDSLLKAFTKYSSVQKARVIRDKRTTKSKGYGFVSFSDGDEYFQAARDMQGKYIGSHPVLLRKSTTEIRPTISKPHGRNNKRGKGGFGSASKHATISQGVQKKQNTDRNGLKILG